MVVLPSSDACKKRREENFFKLFFFACAGYFASTTEFIEVPKYFSGSFAGVTINEG